MFKPYIQSQHVLLEAQHIPDACVKIYLRYLENNGYSSKTIYKYLGAVVHFSRWQRQRGCLCTEATPNDKTRFIELHLANCQCPKGFTTCKKSIAAALSHWLREVCQRHVVPPDRTDSDRLVMAFDSYLKNVAGLSSATRLYRRRYAMEFLEWLSTKSSIQLDSLTAENLSSFICQRAAEVSLASTTIIACSLSCFLRFLSTQGLCQIKPALCVPHPKLLYSLPTRKSLSTAELNQLFSAIDRDNPVGKRDYAIMRCLSDLGLRTSDVANLRLNDIDWHNEVLTINSGKSRRQIKLPMPGLLMGALIDYITDARPETQTHFIFVYHRAPFGKPVKTSTVRGVVRRAFVRAGFSLSQSQAHRLRHTLATRLLMNGTPLKIIADVLGHQCVDTTTRYTYVSQKALCSIGLPWPGRIA